MEWQETFYSGKNFEKINAADSIVQNKIFEECIFTNCDFSNVSFFKSRFVDCFFIDCNLSNIKLANVGLQKISFRECKLMGIDFSMADHFLFEVKFESCVLDFSSFMDKKMCDTLFQFCSLKSVVFIKTNLKGSKFEQADLQDAIFEDSNLSEVDFIDAENYMIDPERNNIKKAKFALNGLPGLLYKYNIEIV